MPIYEYKCDNCGFECDELQSINDPPLTKCPNCGMDTLKKLISSGTGLIFKGSGFYLTDYKKKSSSHLDSGSKSSKPKDTNKDSTTSNKKD